VRNEQDDDTSYETDRLPALLATLDPVGQALMERVVEDFNRQLETDVVLGLVGEARGKFLVQSFLHSSHWLPYTADVRRERDRQLGAIAPATSCVLRFRAP
jgi:hypothetical protein